MKENTILTAISKDHLVEYLNLVGYEGDALPTLNTLKALHQLHPQKIPFEGLNPLLKNPVSLNIEDVIEKLVWKGRGGYCFEQNTLFYHVLILLGFNVKCLAARSLWSKPEGAKAQKTHMLLLVIFENYSYIADVGFGGVTLTGPLKFVLDEEQETPHELFKIVKIENEFLIQAKIKEAWKPVYSFDLQEQLLSDYEVSNWYVSTHPESKFTNSLIAAKPVPGKRYALKDNEFVIHHLNGLSEKRIVSEASELKTILQEIFNINTSDLEGLDEKLREIIKV